MKAILMSIKPKWCEKIFNGEKTIEVRKIAPKLETPYKVYVYDTKKAFDITDIYDLSTDVVRKVADGRGKVVGEFVCDRVDDYTYDYCDGVDIDDDSLLETCLEWDEINIYANGKKLHGLHITKPKRYDTPKALWEFTPWCEKSRNTDDNLEMCCNCKNAFSDEDGVWLGCGVTRPPQSWMYVEEIEE